MFKRFYFATDAFKSLFFEGCDHHFLVKQGIPNDADLKEIALGHWDTQPCVIMKFWSRNFTDGKDQLLVLEAERTCGGVKE